MRIGVNAVPLRVSGGGSRYVFTSLMERLLAIDEENEYVIFVHFLGLGVVNQLANIHAHLRWNSSSRRRIWVVEVDCEETIFHYRGEFDLFFGPLNNLQPRIYDRPSVAILHDIQEQYFPEFFSEPDLLARREIYPEICRASTTLVTISEFCKRTVVEKFGIDPDKVAVVYNAPQAGLADRDPEDEGTWRREPLPERFLFYPGNCYLHKNHQMLLDALADLRRDGRDCPSVVFCGFELPGGFPLRREIAERGLAHLCRVFDEVDVDELRYLYRHAVALVVPTLFEGFCMPVVEAMACGCPVVCSDLPVLREVAGEHALYFEPKNQEALLDQLDRVSNDAPLRNRLIAGGRQAARRFSWDSSARQMLDILSEAPARFYGLNRHPRTVRANPTCRIGVLISGTRGAHGVPEAVKNVMATGYTNVVMRVLLSDEEDNKAIQELLDDAGIRHKVLPLGEMINCGWCRLREFAEEERLDLVGELLAGYSELLPTSLHSLALACAHDPGKALYVGEAWENEGGRIARCARLRLLGNGLWKLEGFLHPEMMYLNPQGMAQWPEGDRLGRVAEIEWGWGLLGQARQDGAGSWLLSGWGKPWRWELLREAHRMDRLCLIRRTLALCDSSPVSPVARFRALRAGADAVYHADGTPHPGTWLRHLRPVLRPASRVLPSSMRAKGQRIWRHLTGET